MLDDKELKYLLRKSEMTDREQLDVISRYIFDKKKKDVGEIRRPNNILAVQLMVQAYDAAFSYYLGVFNHNLE